MPPSTGAPLPRGRARHAQRNANANASHAASRSLARAPFLSARRLGAAAGLQTHATVARGANGNMLVMQRPAEKGEVIFDLPLDAALRFTRCPDTRRTLSWAAPDAPWVRASLLARLRDF